MTASLAFQSVCAGYGKLTVLRHLSLEVERGTFVAVVGPNGSGKSTLLRLASAVIQPSAGTVLFDGSNLKLLPARTFAQRCAVVPQDGPLPAGVTGRELVMLGRTPHLGILAAPSAHDRAAVEQALVDTDTRHIAERWIDTLSGGERQRLVLARALAQEGELLLLDELTTNLDITHQAAVLELVRERVQDRGLTVLASLHDLTLAALFADRVALLAEGRVLAFGDPDRVLTNAYLDEVFGQGLIVTPHPLHGTPMVTVRRRPQAATA